MCSNVSLLTIPEDAMNLILGKVDFPAICNLRKVCRSLRDYIDATQLNTRLSITCFDHSISMRHSLVCKSSLRIVSTSNYDYQKNKYDENGLKVYRNDKRRYFNEPIEIFDEVVHKDLEKSFQNKNLKFLEINLCDGYDNIDKILKLVRSSLESSPIHVKTLKLLTTKQSEILEVLPWINTDALEIDMMSYRPSSYCSFQEIYLKTNGIVELENWMKIRKLIVFDLIVDIKIQELAHFSEVYIAVEKLTPMELWTLKENALKSPNSTSYCIFYKQPLELDDVIEKLGPNHKKACFGWEKDRVPHSMDLLLQLKHVRIGKSWTFDIDDSDQLVYVYVSKYRMTLQKIEKSELAGVRMLPACFRKKWR